jgi:hypothetical protein
MIHFRKEGDRHPITNQICISFSGLGGERWGRAMTVKLPKGTHGAQAKKNDDQQPNYDQSDDEIPLSGIR